MFLAVTARPRTEYRFDGKIGIWPFTVERKALRSDKRTGTVAGQTTIIESVTVTAEEYSKGDVDEGWSVRSYERKDVVVQAVIRKA